MEFQVILTKRFLCIALNYRHIIQTNKHTDKVKTISTTWSAWITIGDSAEQCNFCQANVV